MKRALRPGEMIRYRSRTPWTGIFWLWAFFLALAAGFFAVALAGTALFAPPVDWTGYIGVCLFIVILLSLFGLGLIGRAMNTRVIITDERVLYRGCLDVAPNWVSRDKVADLMLEDAEYPVPGITLSATDGTSLKMRWIDSAHEIYALLTGQPLSSLPPRLSQRAHALIALGTFLWTIGAFALGGLGFYLISEILLPFKADYDTIMEAMGLPSELGSLLFLLAMILAVLPPIMAMGVIGGGLACLPGTLLVRIFLNSSEARDLAHRIAENRPVSAAAATIPQFGSILPFFDVLLNFWTGGPRRLVLLCAERLLTRLYGVPIPFR